MLTTKLAATYSMMYATAPWMARDSRTARRTSRLGLMASPPRAVTDSKADQEQDRDRALEENVGHVVGQHDRGQVVVGVAEFGVGHAEGDRQNCEGDQRGELDGVDDDRRHRGTGDAAVGDHADQAGEDEGGGYRERLV